MSATWPTPIPVAERLPDTTARVLARSAERAHWEMASYGAEHEGEWIGEEGWAIDVTHWLPLPPPVEDPRVAEEPPYAVTRDVTLADVQGIADRLLAKLREAPDDDARFEILTPIRHAVCFRCGRLGPLDPRGCQCWNDE